MGNYLSRFGPYHCWSCKEKDIITQDRLDALEEIVNSLRRNVRVLGHGWVFRGEGVANQGVVNEIVTAIESGCPRAVRSLLDAGWRLEAAQALYIFLTRLEQPLIPTSIQSLVLDNNNRNVPPEVVASDVLGLIREELSLRHRTLIALILNLLDCSIKLSPADELRGHTLPVSMLPQFFNIENHHFMEEWRRILIIFVELIRQASTALTVSRSHSENLR
ncbi:uncharacterized protein LOC115880558 isoform X1 [Sitophilus oryzae]|uniref:Uncharacterized protein LOC115880558 isoform X1 n=1 Tax=Sitophilus oryzae TaxID=7048 RepID=A0A6J2XSQ9_SITOR|nr:uncharacterized protein LOC115880558 isoform X1 [Sitophilus oryzae]